LATECVYSGRPFQEAIAHGREAASLLEQTEDRFWLSQALFTLSYCCAFAGDFDAGLQAATRLDAFADSTGMRRAQANALALGGLNRASRGEGEAGVALCERALAVSPDAFETALILAYLGKAWLEAGDATLAVQNLEEAVRMADQVRSLQFRAWFRTMLAEAHQAMGDTSKASDVAGEALKASEKMGFLMGVGLAKRVLGRVRHDQGNLAAGRTELSEAVKIFDSIGARFELARAKMELAGVLHTLGDRNGAASSLVEARSGFSALQTPVYSRRLCEFSARLGIALPDSEAASR
jgi:tetratricopeptide (TPR) repeat protein